MPAARLREWWCKPSVALGAAVMSADAAPSLQDAQRAAEAVAHLDAGIVLLYGSIALGTATEDSGYPPESWRHRL